MSENRRLKLDRQHMIGLLKAPDFYVKAPAFAYLREVALASWQAYLDNRHCKTCGSEWKFMSGCVDALFIKLLELKRTKDPALEDVRAFIESRKGYPCRPIVIYYRRSKRQGKIAKLQF